MKRKKLKFPSYVLSSFAISFLSLDFDHYGTPGKPRVNTPSPSFISHAVAAAAAGTGPGQQQGLHHELIIGVIAELRKY